MSSLIVKMNVNTNGRDFVVGDIHGSTDQFSKLLELVKFDYENDRVFCVGDLIDRGTDSVGAIKLLENKWFYSVLGNHEQMMLDACGGELASEYSWNCNGGTWHLEEENTDQYDHLVELIAESPLAIIVGDGEQRFIVLHAEYYGDDEMLENEHIEEHVARMLWGRTNIDKGDAPTLGATIYCGHTIVDAPIKVGRHYYMDTGAFAASGYLTMIDTKSGEIYTSR